MKLIYRLCEGLILVLMVAGCDGFGPGLGDFEFDLAGGYILSRSSGDHVEVCPKGAYTLNKDPHIPPKVVGVVWNERFIIAKQYDLKRKWPDKPESWDNLELPDKTKSNYWIIDASIDKVYGPFNALEFKKQKTALGVPDTLILKSVYSYRKEIAKSRAGIKGK